uniref:Secreted protein n=1 Tax=Amphimedon queenslandica TaxID=400682 RepID=A0A1X7SJL2_AMPQE
MILVVLLLCSILQVWVMGTKSRAILCIDIGSADDQLQTDRHVICAEFRFNPSFESCNRNSSLLVTTYRSKY